jgi:putative transposase
VEAITGKPYKPTTQGKNERFHQTLFRYLDKQPLAESLAELQAQVDAFDHLYNTQRPHQGLPGRVTPQTAGEATAKAEAPRPKPDPPFLVEATTRRLRPAPVPVPVPKDLPAGTSVRKLTSAGSFMLAGVHYMVGGPYGSQQVLVIVDGDKITLADLEGEILIEHTRPAPGVTYVGNGRPRGPRPKNSETSPRS